MFSFRIKVFALYLLFFIFTPLFELFSHFSSYLMCIHCLISQNGSDEIRKIPVPPNRYTPLKENWMKIFTPVVQHLNLNIRFNLKTRMVEIRVRFMYNIQRLIRPNSVLRHSQYVCILAIKCL